MNCPKCGKEIVADKMFCNWCDVYIPDIEKGIKAGVFRRFMATAIDPIIIIIFYFIVAAIFASIGGAEGLIVGLFLSIIAYIIFSLWFLNRGLTPGKWLLNLQVVEKNTGSNPGLVSMLLREIVGKFVSGAFLGLGFFWAIWDKDGQAWHDKIAGTIVVWREGERIPIFEKTSTISDTGTTIEKKDVPIRKIATTSKGLRRDLQIALSKKEKTERIMSNLDNLAEKGDVEKDHQLKLKEGYNKTLSEINNDIQKIKERLVERSTDLQRDLEKYQFDKKDIDVKFKIGELEESIYNTRIERINAKINSINTDLDECNTLLRAKSSEDIGGYIDIPTSSGSSGRTTSGTSSYSSTSLKLPELLSDLTIEDFKSFNKHTDIDLTGKTKISIIGAGIMILGTFLPWGGFLGYSAFLFPNPIFLLYLSIGILAMAGNFMKNSKAGSVVLSTAGIIGILINIPSFFGYERAYLAIGYYIFLLGSIVVTYVGISNLKEIS